MTSAISATPGEADSPGSPAGRARRAAVAALWAVRSRAFVDRAGDAVGTVLLLGSARSGTTWLSEIIDRRGDHRVIFEPLKPGTCAELAPWWTTAYLRPGAGTAAQRTAMDHLLSGRLRGAWMDHTNKALAPTRRLVKEISANTLAPWLAHAFPGTRQVVLLRHPHAVVTSRLKLGWRDRLDQLLAEEELVEDYLTGVVGLLQGLTDPYLRMTAQWAIETVVPVRGLADRSAFLVTYEGMRNDPLTTVSGVLDYLGDPLDQGLERALTRPSRTTDLPARRASRDAQTTAAQQATAQDILDRLGLDALYRMDQPQPQSSDWPRIRASVRAATGA